MFTGKPDDGFNDSWSRSMEQCKNSHPSNYLLGDVNLSYPDLTCSFINHQSKLVWIGVVRQLYTSINLGIYIYISINIYDKFVIFGNIIL